MVDTLSDTQVKEFHRVFDEYKTARDEVELSFVAGFPNNLAEEFILMRPFVACKNRLLSSKVKVTVRATTLELHSDPKEFVFQILRSMKILCRHGTQVDTLSDTQVKEFHRVFDEYKTARDEVEYRYIEKMLRKLGYDPSESEMESVYEHLDVYCNGAVSFPQFLTLMASKFSKVKDNRKKDEDDELLKEMKAVFRVFDGDGNGFISQAELKHTLHNMGEKLSDEDIEDMMREADLDGDGQISFPEFCRMLSLQEIFG